jgi:poly-gamma-glutamate capsule biosynthesis protein CapA/YwtB (metallophosphatase superfamily)
VSSIIANTKTLINDSKNFYTSRGATEWTNAKLADVTDIPLQDDTCAQEATDTGIIGTHYLCGDDGTVVTIEANATHITIDNGADTTSLIAKAVQSDKAFVGMKHAHQLGGVGIKR